MKVQVFTKLFVLAIVAGLMLSACAAPTPETIKVTRIVAGTPEVVVVTATPEPVKPVKLTVWQWGAPLDVRSDSVSWEEWAQRKADEFTNLSPGVEIEWARKGQEEGGTTLYIDAAVAAGEPPDIWIDTDFRMAKFAAQGLLEPLEEVLSDDQWAAFDSARLQMVTGADGKPWGIPIGGRAPHPLAINKTLAEEIGVTDLLPQEPDRDWTTDEFVEFCRAVSDPPNRYCTLFFAKTPSFDYTLTGFAGGFGAELYANGDYCHTVINSPDGVKWMEWMNSLIDEGLVVPGPAGLTDEDLDNAWANQQIVLAPGGQWIKSFSQRLVDSGQVEALDVYWVNYPHEPGRPTTPQIQTSSEAAVLFKQDDPDRRAAALKFLQYVAGESFIADYTKGYDMVASRTEVAQDWAGDDPDRQWLVDQVTKHGLQDMGYGVNNYNEIRFVWAEARQMIWSGEMSPQEGLDYYVEQANELLCP